MEAIGPGDANWTWSGERIGGICPRTGCIALPPARSGLGWGAGPGPRGAGKTVELEMDDSGFSFASFYTPSDEGLAVTVVAAEAAPARGPGQDRQFPAELVKLAKRIKAIRQSRVALLDPILFGEPAWDILLALYVAAGERYSLSISALCAESGAPPTTAARSIGRLLELDMVRRLPNPGDNRSAYIELTDDTAARLTELLGSARHKYLAD